MSRLGFGVRAGAVLRAGPAAAAGRPLAGRGAGRAAALAVPAAFLLVWGSAGTVPPLDRVFPAGLGAVARALGALLKDPATLGHAASTLSNVGLGLALAGAVALGLGLAMAWSPLVEDLLDPVVEMLRPVPPLALVPLALLWFGIGNGSKVFLVVLIAFSPILLTTVAGVKNVEAPLLTAARSYGAPTAFLFRKVILPAALPSIWSGLRIAIGRSFTVAVAAEMIAADRGLGWLLVRFWEWRELDRMLALMAIIGMLALGLDLLLRVVLLRGPLAWLRAVVADER